MFSQLELDYVGGQRLARLATVDHEGQPTVDAVGFTFDADEGIFLVGGMNLPASRKYRNVVGGNTKVSLIVDDLVSVDPWTPRGIRVHATAEAATRGGMFGPGEYLVLRPAVTWSWGIGDRDDFRGGRFTPNRTVWDAAADPRRA